MNAFFYLFVEGGVEFMILITLALIGVLFSAWKAPNWIREFGLMGLVLGFLALFIGLFQASWATWAAGDIGPTVLADGIKVVLIAPIYGLIVYLLSLLIKLIFKPRNY